MICGVCGGEFLEQLDVPPTHSAAPLANQQFAAPNRVHFHRHHHHHPISPQYVHVHLQQGSSTFSGMLHGPFGDYVWGENGMDRIVTQLFNQMDGSLRTVGLTDQQINRLPIIKVDMKILFSVFFIPYGCSFLNSSILEVSEEHVEKSTQCTTCFEDFKLGTAFITTTRYSEAVTLELICRHIFHPQCVVPWLQQRPSCPICRQEVLGGETRSNRPGIGLREKG
uniref:RING-type domain-containing protein n=1 Tax=Angiostrongylus cantonensis TaxID=6313 RepID=A0A0K0DAH8_ANGCA